MTQAEFFSLLKSAGLPVSYNNFKSPPPLPYIVYLFSHSTNFGADNKVLAKVYSYQVELYSDKKDLVSELKLENLFDSNDIFYNKTETYIEDEELYQVMYEISI